jgi:ERCC4-type nuclease
MAPFDEPFLVAPTEPPSLRRLGPTSAVPERHGADVVWPIAAAAGGGLAGVQRKELTDLWASLRDGRLARGVAAMSELALKVLLVEGRVRWSASGRLASARAPLTRDQLRGIALSAQRRGIWVLHSDDVEDSRATIVHLRSWHDKPRHPALDVRPGPAAAAGTRAWGVHLLQSFPLVGPITAGNVWDHFGRVPLAWTCQAEELAAVKGVGPVRADALWRALG